jgi:hypothetical protein
MRIRKAVLLRIALPVPVFFAAYATLLCAPEPFFSFSVRADNLTLHSDRPFPVAAAKHVLKLTEAKLASSPLYSSRQQHDVFICNSRWRQRLFFNKDYGVGGVAPYPVTSNVFLRDASIAENRLISPRGTPVSGDRTLDYFIAHDYVGKGNSFDYVAARRAFLAEVPEMDWKRSGLYWRFHLEVAYLLDHRRWSVTRLLGDPPPENAVDTGIREERP